MVEYFLHSVPATLNLVPVLCALALPPSPPKNEANNFANSKEVLLTSKQLFHYRTIIYLDRERRIFTEGNLVSIGSKKLRSSVLKMSFEFHKGKTFSLLHCGYAVAAVRRHTQQLLFSNIVWYVLYPLLGTDEWHFLKLVIPGAQLRAAYMLTMTLWS